MTFAMGGAPAPGSDRIPVELFQILKDDAVESAALNMQYAGSRQELLSIFSIFAFKKLFWFLKAYIDLTTDLFTFRFY